MSSQKIESFDVSPKLRRIIEWRYAKRKELRHQYLKEILNPIKQTMPIDTSVQRFAMMRIRQEYLTKVTARAHVLATLGYFTFIVLGIYGLQTLKNNEEHIYRTGQVKYVDRKFKFV